MYNSKFMNILNSTYNLFKYFASLSLSHFLFADNVIKKLPILHVLHN